jgi:protein TonB
MSRLKLAYVGAAAATVLIHAAAFGGLTAMKQPEPEKHLVSVMVSQPKKKEKAKPPEPPKPIEAPKEILQRPTQRAAPAKLAPAPPDPIAAAHPALAAMPDFGISLSGGLPGAGGIAIPLGGGQAPSSVQPKAKEKVLGVAAERPGVASGDCAEDLVKAKPQGFVKANYTDDARAAGIEGRVRVEISIDESGHVLSAKVLTGLGHGLDESAVEAAKRMAFTPATRCGTALKSSFVVSMRFVLGE